MSAVRAVATQPSRGAIPANALDHIGCRSGGKGQRDTISRRVEFLYAAAPDRLDRHPGIAGVHEVQNTGSGIVPDGHSKRPAGPLRADDIGVPMCEGRGAGHRPVGFVADAKLDRLGPLGSVDYSRIRHVAVFGGRGQRRSQRAEETQKNRIEAAH